MMTNREKTTLTLSDSGNPISSGSMSGTSSMEPEVKILPRGPGVSAMNTTTSAPLIRRTSPSIDIHGSEGSSTTSIFDLQKQNIRALSLIVCTFTYLMVGAAIFDALESDQDQITRELVDDLQKRMQNKYNFSSKDYKVLEQIVWQSIPQKAGFQWRFAGAFYFATVVITTVGYGHSTPGTFKGKAFCIVYALAGIPLNLVMFQSIGERLNTLIGTVLRKGRRWVGLPAAEVSMTHMIMVSSTLGSLVVVIGTYLFNKYEKWGYFDSFYYCFITLTTIGFGDYVAMQKENALSSKTEYVIFSLLFILFGMALFAAAVNLFVLRFMATTNDNESLGHPPRKTIILKTLGQSENELNNLSTTTAANVNALATTDHATLGAALNRPPNRQGSLMMGDLAQLQPLNDSQSSLKYPWTAVVNNRVYVGTVTKSPRRKGTFNGFNPCYECYLRILRKLGFGQRPRYTVRRAPCRISHLLGPNSVAPNALSTPSTEILERSTSGHDSILMTEMKRAAKRRPSL